MGDKRVLRHKPVQKRSRTRVEEILRAAEIVFHEKGYETSTTNAIAEQANIPIGSLYQYFKNKKAILDTLSEKYTGELKELFLQTFSKNLQKKTLYDESDTLLDNLAYFYANHAAFQVVLYGASRNGDLDNASDELRQHIISFVYVALSKMLPEKKEDHMRLIATILVAIARSILPAAIKQNGQINRVVLEELKRVIRAYLKSYIESE